MTKENQPQKQIRKPNWENKKSLIKLDESVSEFYCEDEDVWFRIVPPEKLSTDRFIVLEEKIFEFAFTKKFEDVIGDISRIYDNSRDGLKHSDNRVLAFNLLWSLRNLRARKSRALDLCGVFIVSDKEDEAEYSDTQAEKNKKIWRKYYENDFFFQLAANTLAGYKEFALVILRAYLGKEVMEHYLNQREEIMEELIKLGRQKGA